MWGFKKLDEDTEIEVCEQADVDFGASINPSDH